MNIYDKLPIKFIKWATQHGMQLTLWEDYIDLNTGMKSHLHLYYGGGKYLAKMRYGTVDIISEFSDLYWAIRRCEHGKGFMSGSIEYTYNNGFGDLSDEEFC